MMNSISEFFSMNGFGFFIWSSYGMMAIIMIIELINLKLNRKATIKEIRKTVRILQENHESTK